MSNIYRFFQRTIANGAIAEINVYGRFVTMLSNSINTDLKLQIGEGASFETFPAGLAVEIQKQEDIEKGNFKLIRIKNDTGSSATVKIAVSKGVIVDSRTTISGTVTVEKPSALQHTADVTVDNTAGGTTLVAANADRKFVRFSNMGSETVRIGANGTVTATNGTPLKPGQSLIMESTSEISAIAISATSTTIAVLEEETT